MPVLEIGIQSFCHCIPTCSRNYSHLCASPKTPKVATFIACRAPRCSHESHLACGSKRPQGRSDPDTEASATRSQRKPDKPKVLILAGCDYKHPCKTDSEPISTGLWAYHAPSPELELQQGSRLKPKAPGSMHLGPSGPHREAFILSPVG